MSTPPPAPEPDDAVILEAMTRLINDEADGARTTLTIGPYAAFVMLGALQLAWRHPYMNGSTADIIRGIGGQLQAIYAHEPALSALLDKGWDRKHDAALPPADPAARTGLN
jgi:hypothetical protein